MSGTFSYLCYGLSMRSDMLLPELVAGEVAEEEKQVSIRLGRVQHPPSLTLDEGWSYLSPSPGEDYLFWQGVGSALVSNRRDITIEPSPGVDERILRHFVLGPVLAALLHQRGYLLVHASAVTIDGEAVVFLGSAGWGKSTIAGALHSKGHRLVSDDMTVLDVEGSWPMVLPGFPQLKLWPEAITSLGGDPKKLPRTDPYFEKRARPATHHFSLRPVPLKQIYVLGEGSTLQVLPLSRQESLVELIRHSYGTDYGFQTSTEARSVSHFRRCARVVSNVPVRSLKRQKSLPQLSEVMRLIEEDLARNTTYADLSTG